MIVYSNTTPFLSLSSGILAKAKSLGLIDSFLKDAMSMKEKGIHYNNMLIERIAHELGEL